MAQGGKVKGISIFDAVSVVSPRQWMIILVCHLVFISTISVHWYISQYRCTLSGRLCSGSVSLGKGVRSEQLPMFRTESGETKAGQSWKACYTTCFVFWFYSAIYLSLVISIFVLRLVRVTIFFFSVNLTMCSVTSLFHWKVSFPLPWFEGPSLRLDWTHSSNKSFHYGLNNMLCLRLSAVEFLLAWWIDFSFNDDWSTT